MSRATVMWVYGGLVAGVLSLGLAGCGGGWDAEEIPGYEAAETTGESAAPGAEAPAGQTDAREEAESPGDAPQEESGRRPDPGGAPGRLLAICRDLAEDAPGLSDRARERLIRDCEGAATGDEETLRRATEAVCVAAAYATMPGLARGPATDACKRLIP